MRFVAIIVLLSISICSTAQSFRGQVVDSETGLLIQNATIQYDDKGIIADSLGWFTIEDPEYPIILNISHVSYHSRDFIIQSIQESGMIMRLIPKTLNIDEIQIIGEKVKRYFEKKYYYITDYLLLDNYILSIGFEKSRMNKGIIAMSTYSNDTLAIIYVDKPKKLYQDAFNQIFLFANDSAYQVLFDGEKLNLIFPFLAGNFPQANFNIQFTRGENEYYIKERYENGQIDRYKKLEIDKYEFTPIKDIYDIKNFRSINSAISHQPMKGNFELDAWIAEIYHNRYIFKPVISDIFEYDDGVIIFDLTNHYSYIYDKEIRLTKKIKNSFPIHDNYEKNVLKDVVDNKFYWVHYKGSHITLQEIDIETGTISRTIIPPRYPLIENIQIRKGEVWFLYQPKLGESVRSLFRLKT